MEILIITLVECAILGISYVFFSKDVKRKKTIKREKILLLRNFYEQEIKRMGTLPLAGIENDENGDYDVIKAIKKIELPDTVRIKL